jgi:hypothetical protein
MRAFFAALCSSFCSLLVFLAFTATEAAAAAAVQMAILLAAGSAASYSREWCKMGKKERDGGRK